MKNLDDVRRQIDRLDFDLLRILNERMELALTSRKFKTATTDPKREEDVLKRAAELAPRLVSGPFIDNLFHAIMNESKRLQETEIPLVGFQGEHGANGEMAVALVKPDSAPIPCDGFVDVFDGVEGGYLDYGVVPVENSLGGMVAQVNELMARRDFFVVGEVLLPIRHSLLVLPGTHHRDVRVVLSHPQALAQCREFLERHGMEGRPVYDTAGAARILSTQHPEGTGVIANELCARLYHLDIMKAGIEDHADNVTRFLVIAREPVDSGNKCSIVFSTAHKSGALYDILQLFADKNINLTRIESVPLGGRPGNYVFFLDLMGSITDPSVSDVLKTVERQVSRYRFLGCYASGEIS